MSSSTAATNQPSPASNAVPGTWVSLKSFLTDAPTLYQQKLEPNDEKQILTNCYRALWNNNPEWLQRYFFKEGLSDQQSLAHLLEKYDLFGDIRDDDDQAQVLANNSDNEIVDPTKDEPEYWESQRGKQCGHLFKKGETVYRCRNCGLDDTCVLCSRCFHATDHEGHDVKIWLGQGTGGCCDCGDPEAWKVPLECRIHSLHAKVDDKGRKVVLPTMEPRSSLPQPLLDAMDDTLRVVLDYLLETFATSPEKVSPGTVEEVLRDTQDSHAALNIRPPSPDSHLRRTYACVLWNDERHSFEQVIDIVTRSTGKSKAEAQKDAEAVDTTGRHVVFTSDDIQKVARVAQQINGINLAVTVRSTENTLREDICGVLLVWLKSLISGRLTFFHSVQGGSSILRDAICKILCEDWCLPPNLAALSTRSRRERRPDNDDTNADSPYSGPELDMTDDENINEDEAAAMVFMPPLDFLDDEMEMIDPADIEEIVSDHSVDPDDMNEDDTMDDPTDMDYADEHDADDDDPMDYQSAEDATEWLPSPVLSRDTAHDLATTTEADAPTTPRRRRRSSSSSSTSSSNPMARGVPNPSQLYRIGLQSMFSGPAHPSEVLVSTQTDIFSNPRRSTSLQGSQHRRRSSQNKPCSDIVDLSYDLDAWLATTEKKEQIEIEINQALGIPVPPPSPSFMETNALMKKEFSRKLRLDYLLQFDLRLWKIARTSIKDLLIGTLISNFDYRPALGMRYVRNYPDLVDAFFFKDREPEHSISSLSVQLLTVPTVAWLLVKKYRFYGVVCSILSNFFLTDHVHMMLPDHYRRMQVDCRSRSITRHRYAFTFFDLRYVLNADAVKTEVTKDPLYLRYMVDMLYQFQAMDPLQRQRDTHVEYESNSWVSAFNVTLQIAKICHMFAECYSPSLNGSPMQYADRLETARRLCRSIYRVIHEIAQWAPEKSTELQSTLGDASAANDGAPQVLIRGIQQQIFKTIKTPHAGDIQVIEYDVTREPVSFHHPFHWLLSELLEHVTLLSDDVLADLGWRGGFKHMIQRAGNTSNDLFLSLLEYPLRTIVLLSQINCGVWVRNGYGVRNQARTYRDISVRGNTYDRDIYLLQTGFVASNPDRLLVTMLDRFKLWEWFSGKIDQHPSDYEPSQLIYMVEEFLNLLVISATELGYASAMSVQDHIRRYIIQYLGISVMSHSELVKLVPEHLHEHEAFEATLLQLATYKPPDGLNDYGTYELKDQYYDELDPFFWHFTRNHREEAFDALRKHRPQLAKTDPSWSWLTSSSASMDPSKKKQVKEELLVMPTLPKIASGPFTRLGEFLHSPILCQIITHALWNMKAHTISPSDTILETVLYLAMLAVQNIQQRSLIKAKGKQRAEESSSASASDDMAYASGTTNFIDHAIHDTYAIKISSNERERVTLLTVLLRCLNDSNLEHIHKRLYYIVDHIERHSNNESKRTIDDWRQAYKEAHVLAQESASNAQSEYERKKAAAKARQAAIMSQFAQAQSQFLSQHGDLYEDAEDDNLSPEERQQDPAAMDYKNLAEGDQAEVQRMCHFPSGTCIVCQEELNRSGSIYGMLGLVQHSHVLRHTPFKQAETLEDICDTAQGKNSATNRMEASRGPKPELHGFPVDANTSGLHVSSCGHLMHAECFENYQASVEHDTRFVAYTPLITRRRFLCPLCKALGNILLPILWKGKPESYPGVVQPHTDYTTVKDQLTTAYGEIRETLLNQDPTEHIPGAYHGTRAAAATSPSTSPANDNVTQENDGQTTAPARPEFAALANMSPTTADALLTALDSLLDSPHRQPHALEALRGIYTQLLNTFKMTAANNSQRMILSLIDLKQSIVQLFDMYAYTIAAIEIAQRGQQQSTRDVTVEHTGLFLDDISAQNQTLLKILAFTMELLPRIMEYGWLTEEKHLLQRVAMGNLYPLLYPEPPSLSPLPGFSDSSIQPLLCDDPFRVMTSTGFSLAPSAVDPHHLMHLMLLAEITKAIVGLMQSLTGSEVLEEERVQSALAQVLSFEQDHVVDDPANPTIMAMQQLAEQVMTYLSVPQAFTQQFLTQIPGANTGLFGEKSGAVVLVALVRTFTLPFLRKCLLLMVAQHGYVPPLPDTDIAMAARASPLDAEYDRLLTVLRLPSFDKLIQLSECELSMVSRWCQHYYMYSMREGESKVPTSAALTTVAPDYARLLRLQLNLPTPFSLVTLPYRMDQLLEESSRRICRNCKTVPEDPALCLFCGTIVCGRRFCCMQDSQGECNLHMRACGGEVGLYMVIKECLILLLHDNGGTIMSAPYLDSHGEADIFLKRGAPQYLNIKRYEQLRQLWLTHSIPAFVRRRMEVSHTYQRWETW
ncbi:hypothetical protein DM01DRAFT_1315943 [Hesseltinella vesiculosa]|uniref:E3 ubiquitin-protein ligase n=1 Tax=Hesseltinella vesiculosa TaxID=101127 RepID=A0A1X2GWP5_9FUNG|nr:hypothetical protein DM01DRAFT_1315943 [Hesseltinella vesiculosa]